MFSLSLRQSKVSLLYLMYTYVFVCLLFSPVSILKYTTIITHKLRKRFFAFDQNILCFDDSKSLLLMWHGSNVWITEYQTEVSNMYNCIRIMWKRSYESYHCIKFKNDFLSVDRQFEFDEIRCALFSAKYF